MKPSPDAASVLDPVRSTYAATARAGLSSDHPGVAAIAHAFGYSAEELAAIPAQANMGLSCGNPTAMASLQPGEVVVDLGCGGGMDVFLAAQHVGPTGKAIGIDMTPDMIDLARRNAAKSGATNVAFHLGRIDAIPLPDASADVIISNCVINLAPDKDAVFAEMARVLKPGGRVAVSDIALKQPLPPEMEKSVAAWVGCIAGAISISAYQSGLTGAGFAHVLVQDSGADLNAYAQGDGAACCCAPGECGPSAPRDDNALSLHVANDTPATAPALHTELSALLTRFDINAYAASVKVYAVKPG